MRFRGSRAFSSWMSSSPDAGVEASGTRAEGRFEVFFEAESPLLYRRLCLVARSSQEAEEIMQDAFLKLWERWDRVSTMENPPGYLYRTAFRIAYRRGRRVRLSLPMEAGRKVESSNEFASSETRLVLGKALRSCTHRQRAALVLTELLGYRSEEAAEILGVRPGTVRTLASQGRRSLRAALGGQDG